MSAANRDVSTHIARQDGGDVLLQIRVQPRGGRNAIDGVRGDALLVRVTAPPEDGKANAAVIEVLSRDLKIAKSRIRIERGETLREKVLRIFGADVGEIESRLNL
jgi:uncharacterized protein (TIGR00251 family)